jgi:NADH-quinone oxidoreductase subunit E
MSASASHIHFEQPKSFTFTPDNMKAIEKIVAKYPKGRQASAVMPLLDIAQRQHNNWIPEAAMEEIARILDMPKIKVFEVATFYTMYNLAPKGKHHIQICTTSPCCLSGAQDVLSACEKHLGIKSGGTTADGQFTITEVECLGSCVNAPVFQYNGDEYYEDVSPEIAVNLLDDFKAGKKPQTGTQRKDRFKSMSAAGATCLTEQAQKAGVRIAGEKK